MIMMMQRRREWEREREGDVFWVKPLYPVSNSFLDLFLLQLFFVTTCCWWVWWWSSSWSCCLGCKNSLPHHHQHDLPQFFPLSLYLYPVFFWATFAVIMIAIRIQNERRRETMSMTGAKGQQKSSFVNGSTEFQLKKVRSERRWGAEAYSRRERTHIMLLQKRTRTYCNQWREDSRLDARVIQEWNNWHSQLSRDNHLSIWWSWPIFWQT